MPFEESMFQEQIRNLAYSLWEQRGRPMGSGEDDWNRAVDEVRSKYLAGTL